MINKIILMFIPSGVSLGLVGAYLISQGTSPVKAIAILAISAFIMAVIMVRVAQDDDDYYQEDNNDE